MDEFLNFSRTEQLFYHAVKEAEEKRRANETKNILTAIAKIMGAKVRR